MRLTNPQRRALQILADHGSLKPGEFARFMWPDNEWLSTMSMTAGSYLNKLRKKGYVQKQWDSWNRCSCYVLTDQGQESLDEDRKCT